MSRITTDRNSTRQLHINKFGKQTNPIIYGYFPHKTYNEMAITRVNRTLCTILGIFIMISFVSYYFVTSSEMTLNKIGKETIRLNNENVELQNRLDNLHSYNKVDRIVRQNNFLNTAKQVIEVPESIAAVETGKRFPIASADSHKWAIGY